ncbi:hypothetical protein OVA24_11820 [Luteolibacter sp. SL250]|uniref:hypothetical protein n=1 Tax=Luteolibacter sp. SL250 TaxID=2995170 RepID=UPI00226E5F1F|nr:hypothetical protein [Luteolibacter sp. SL250]WAC17927.1 hypothetical protein OVA24_11820 [Luteolibacter sp. SL250]
MKNPISALLFLLSVPCTAGAATLATYAFANGPATPPSTLGVTAGVIAYGPGLGTPQTSAATFGTSGANALGLFTNATTPTTVPAAVSANSFFTFTLTPDPGTSVAFTGLSLWANYSGDDRSANELALQIDSGSGFQTIGTVVMNVTGAASPGKFYNIPISGLDPVEGPATFRVVMYDSAGVTWSSFTRMDDIAVSGTIIPEPSSCLIACAASCLPLLRRNRRSRR